MAIISRGSYDAWLDEKDKRESKDSLYYFGKIILGYPLVEKPHREICDFVQNKDFNFKMVLLPRGTMKTSIISQIFSVWDLTYHPSHRILLDSEILKNSERNLNVIKSIFETNKRYKYLFENQVNPARWTQSEITIKSRVNLLIKEPSVGTCSMDTVEIGPHWNLIIADDLQSEKNTRTKEQIDAVYEHFRLLFSLGDVSDFGIVVVGTRWCDMDIYGRILENHKEFHSMVRPAIYDNGELYYPSVLTKEKLDFLRGEQGPDMYNAQYMNNPLPQGENASFKKEWFRYEEKTPKDINLVLEIDPAASFETGSCFFALVASGFDTQNNLHIADYKFGHWNLDEAMKHIFLMLDKHPNIKDIAVETIAFQKIYKFELEKGMRARNKFCRIHELKYHESSKHTRIMGLQPRYSNGAVYHLHWMKDGEMEEEFLKFPRGRRKDLIDASSFILEISTPRGEQKKTAGPIDLSNAKFLELYRRDRCQNQNSYNPYLGAVC